MVIHGNEDVVEPEAAAPHSLAPAVDAPAPALRDPAELLHIDM